MTKTINIAVTEELTIGGTTARSKAGTYEVKIDLAALPTESVWFALRYGLKQYLADGAAGAGSNEELRNGVDERLRKLANADFTRRGNGEAKEDTETGRALKLARQTIRQACKANNVPVPEKEKLGEMAKSLIEANPKYREDAKKQLEAERKAAETFAGDNALQAMLASLAGVGGEED